MILTRVRCFLLHPVLWVGVVFFAGTGLRVHYTLAVHRPVEFVYSDMNFYLSLANEIARGAELQRWDVTHPLGYPWLLSVLLRWDPSLMRATYVHLLVSIIVPLAVGLLGRAAFGRRTGYASVVFASVYFPFIEFGATFLAEIHFTLWLSLSFASLFAASRANTWFARSYLSLLAGATLSVAASLKSVALPAAASFFIMQLASVAFTRGALHERARWLKHLGSRVVLTVAAASPLLLLLTRVCTRANQGKFCMTGNKIGADFLLGHYGRIESIRWAEDEGHFYQFGSPGAVIRHYTTVESVPFPITDSAANAEAAWAWIGEHPLDAVVLSLDHIYDTFFGYGVWPTYASPFWRYAHLSQYAFVLLLLLPAVLALYELARRGARSFISGRLLSVLAPVGALACTVAFATGEVRYRIPFDVFFIAVACAYVFSEVQYDGGMRALAFPVALPVPDAGCTGNVVIARGGFQCLQAHDCDASLS